MASREFAIREFGKLAERYELAYGWDFEFDRAVKRFGCCNHTHQNITLSATLLPAMTESEVTEVLKHEIAHALVGPKHGHDMVWKRKAQSMGIRGDRCSTPNAKVSKIIQDAKRVVAYCPHCNKIVHRQQRMPRNVQFDRRIHNVCRTVVQWRRV